MNRYIQASLFALLPAIGTAFLSDAAPPQEQYPKIEAASHKGYTEKISDKASFDMVPIPGGTYQMGSPDDEKGRNENEGPQRLVSVKPFWMAKLEISWDEYDIYWENRPQGPPPRPKITDKPPPLTDALTSPTPPYDDPTFGFGKKGFPVIAVTHHAAMEYCRWLSEKTGKKYRLPTEAEWEWACRAGKAKDDFTNFGDYAWYEKNADDMPHPVGKKNPNAWGLHDINGNVAEWCIDSYKKDYFSLLPKDKLSIMPVVLPTEKRYPDVVRGGSWIDPPEKCRSAIRRFSDKSWLKRDPQRPQSIWWMTDADWVGFRVVRAVEEHETLKGVRSKVNWLSD